MTPDDIISRYETKYRKPAKKDGAFTEHFVLSLIQMVIWQDTQVQTWKYVRDCLDEFFDKRPQCQGEKRESTMD